MDETQWLPLSALARAQGLSEDLALGVVGSFGEYFLMRTQGGQHRYHLSGGAVLARAAELFAQGVEHAQVAEALRKEFIPAGAALTVTAEGSQVETLCGLIQAEVGEALAEDQLVATAQRAQMAALEQRVATMETSKDIWRNQSVLRGFWRKIWRKEPMS